MAAVCKKHMKIALKQYIAPHVKSSSEGQTCKYCGGEAAYIIYYAHTSLFNRKHDSKSGVS